MWISANFFAGCFGGGSGGIDDLRYLCANITMNTSTSYIEAMNMPIGELMLFCDALNEISEERQRLIDEAQNH